MFLFDFWLPLRILINDQMTTCFGSGTFWFTLFLFYSFLCGCSQQCEKFPLFELEQEFVDMFFFAFIVSFSKFIHVQLSKLCFFKVCFLFEISLFQERVVTHLSVSRDIMSLFQ
ncbi:Hypothetical_protein [Hexamita inflata]|uniref:Hypothetical_protein n=1 Tax=Hexamita inflata TaxID=28002 RepID=A0AA86P8R6_9EUKA|nr:Hypothetical protein HINF_LOCUS19884 [Hexamita inflata]